MSTRIERTVIGTKPAESIIAEFRATLPELVGNKPTGAGWVESRWLRDELGLSRGQFLRVAKANCAAGKWVRCAGSKVNASGGISATLFYKVAKPSR